MEKNLTNYEIVTILNGIQQEIFTNKETEFNLKFAWKLRKNIKTLMAVNEMYTEEMQKIEQSFADDEHSNVVTDENGTEQRQVKQEYAAEFNKKRNELLACENKVNIETASIDEMGIEKISPVVLDLLSFMIDEEA